MATSAFNELTQWNIFFYFFLVTINPFRTNAPFYSISLRPVLSFSFYSYCILIFVSRFIYSYICRNITDICANELVYKIFHKQRTWPIKNVFQFIGPTIYNEFETQYRLCRSSCDDLKCLELLSNIFDWDRDWFQILVLILSKLFNFYSPWNYPKPYGFLLISGQIEVNLIKIA